MSNLPFGPNASVNVNSTTTLQSIADQLKVHTRLQNYVNVGGIDGQPMLGIAQRVNQMLLSRRMAWKFNRVEMGSNNPALNPYFFVSQMGYQDFKHAGATCFSLINSLTPGGVLPAGGAGVDLNPGTYQNGRALVSYGTFDGGEAYYSNLPINGTLTPMSVTWQSYGVILNPANGQITVQFLDPHPFQAGNIGTTPIIISGVVNPAFNSTFTYNTLNQSSQWVNTFALLSIPDAFHIVLQGTNGQYGTLSHVSATGGVTTVTVPNSMSNGDLMTFTGVVTNSGLNSKTVTLLSTTSTTVSFTTPTGVTITNGSDSGTIYAASSGAPGIWNLGWIQAASLFDVNNPSFPLPVNPIDAVHRLAAEYTSTGDTLSISCEKDYGNGVVKFRLSEPVSTYPFAFTVTFQAKAPVFTSGQSIFQWPDDLSYVLFEMCLWQAMRFAYGSTAAETNVQMEAAARALLSALESEDREANDMAMTPQMTLQGWGGLA